MIIMNLLNRRMLLSPMCVAALTYVQAVNAQTTLLSDDFAVDANVNNPNYEISNGRQGGTQATSLYTYNGNVQVGHSYVPFGQPVGDTNLMLLAQGSWAYNDLALNDSLLNGSPLSVSFGLYASYSGANPNDWMAFSVGNFGSNPQGPWPTSNQFGLIVHQNGALDIFDGSTDVFSQSAGYVTNPNWEVVFGGASGNGSPLDGTTYVSIYDGGSLIDQFNMANPLSSGDEAGFYAYNTMIGGVGNLEIAAVPEPTTLALAGLGLGALLVSRRRKF